MPGPFTALTELVSDGFGRNVHRSSLSEVTLWGFGSASHLQCNSVAGCSPTTTCCTVTTVRMMIITVVINNSSNNNNWSSVLFNILPLKFKSQKVKVKFIVNRTMKLVLVISQRIEGVISP